MKRNILFITGQFLPYTKSAGGILRVYSFLQTLKNKHNLYLLTNSGPYYGYLGFSKKTLKEIKIIYLRNKKKNLITFSKSLLFRILNYNKIFRNLLYLFCIDYSLFFIDRYYEKTVKIINEQKINYIVFSGPPFSLFFLIKKIKVQYPSIKIIIDYRDGWTGRINCGVLYIIKQFIRNFIEKKIIKFADFIIAATNSIKTNLSLLTSKKITLLTNGFLNISRSTKQNKSKKILIGYFGLISDKANSYRDLSILFNILKKNKSLQQKYAFYFYGNNTISDLNIKNFPCFKFNNHIPHNKVLKIMSQMDYLLIFHTEKNTSKEVITGKLYDYIASRKPIIFISAGETEGGSIIKNYHLGYSVNYLKYNLHLFFHNLKKNYPHKLDKNISIFSRKFQNKKFLQIIK
jgi:hypothetical protein